MPQRTIAAGGGNWNSTSTWVEGAVPTASDFVVGNASSGQLTVNVNATIQYVDFSAYTQTLTINSNITLTTASTGTSTIGSGMSFNFLGSGSSQGKIAKGSGAQTYIQNGTTQIPHFAITNGTGTLTLGSNLYVSNYRPTTSGQMNGNTLFIYSAIDAGFNSIFGTTIFRFVGTGTIAVLITGNNGNPCEFVIDCSGGTATISSAGFGIGQGQNNTNITFRHLSGTIVNPTFRPAFNGGTSVHTFDLISGTTWDLYGAVSINTPTISLTNPSYFDKFLINQLAGNAIISVNLSGNNFFINELNLFNVIQNQGGTYYRSALDVAIQTGITVNIAQVIDINGGSNEPNPSQTPNLEIKSQTPGVQATLNVNTFSQYVSRTRFTDINCSGGNTLYGQNLTLSNTTNITQYTLPPSTGGGQTAYTFAS